MKKIPAQKVTWFGVYRKMTMFSGRMLEAVVATHAEASAFIDERVKKFADDRNKYMIEDVEVKMHAYQTF